MRALALVADRKIELVEGAAPALPAAGEVQIAIKAIGLNHIDVWGWRGMAFAKRKLPLIGGVEAAGEISAVGPDVSEFKIGDCVVAYGALTCGICRACREGRDNLCENVGGIMGFHLDGFARDFVNMSARLVIPVPKGVSFVTPLALPSPSPPSSTCCSTTPNWSRAKRSWCKPAVPASVPPRSRWRRRSAARCSRQSATTKRRRKPRRLAPTT